MQRRGQLGDFWLSQRPNSRQWCRTWFDSATRQTRRASLGTDDFEQAEQALAQWFVAHRTVRDERPEHADVAAVMLRHYEIHAKKLRSHATVRKTLGYWAEYFEGATVADLTPDRIEAFAKELFAADLSSGYVRRILADGKSALNTAWKRQELARVPFVNLALAPEGAPRKRILSVSEMAALWNALDASHLRMFVLLSLGTMGRVEAVLDLTAFSIDWTSGSIDLLPAGRERTKKRRPIIPLVPTLRRALAAHREGPLVAYHGRAVASVRTTFRKAIQRAGLADTGVCQYTLRHTIISEAMKRCSEPWQVERFAGHQQGSKTTERYTKFSPGYLSKAAEAVEDYFADLEAKLGGKLPDLIQPAACELRVSHPGKLVEPRGIEPLTFAMPLRRSPS